MSDDRLVLKKNALPDYKNIDFMSSQNWIFLKWLSDDFHQKIENIPFCLFLNKMGFENMFDDHLVRKQALIDWKILILHSGHIGIFPKGLNHDFSEKKMEIHLCLFFDIQGLKIMFDDYLVQKQPITLVNKILKKFLFVCFWRIEA